MTCKIFLLASPLNVEHYESQIKGFSGTLQGGVKIRVDNKKPRNFRRWFIEEFKRQNLFRREVGTKKTSF